MDFAVQELCGPISPNLIDMDLADLEHLQLAYPSPQPSELNITSHHVDFDLSFGIDQPIANLPYHSPHGSAMQHSDDPDTGPCLDLIQCGSGQELGISPYLDFSWSSGAGPHLGAESPDLSSGADLNRDSLYSWDPPLQHQTTSQPPASYNWVELNFNGIQPTPRDPIEPIESPDLSQDSSPTMYQLLNHVWKLDNSNLLGLKVLIDRRVSGSIKTEPSNMLQDQNILSNLDDSMSNSLNSQSSGQSDDGPTHSKPIPLCVREKPPNLLDPQSNRPSGTLFDYEMMRYPCSFPNCKKSFKRKEHARRHYST
ncbi:hypothetical protein FAGAP_5597 [Fusarium agapanthi]|uniref:C2H2-type domain-containing protein n=1 Tax=Fusarium agapanthi TaxID=1803897 RepID=A0A9P5BGK5_9HYPO|nr:hypothetical protein FAGAP_5597 [Fusarium agapanthi]